MGIREKEHLELRKYRKLLRILLSFYDPDFFNKIIVTGEIIIRSFTQV